MTDLPRDTTSTARVAVGGTYSGVYETPGDTDAIGFDVIGGATYRLTVGNGTFQGDSGDVRGVLGGETISLIPHGTSSTIYTSPREDGTLFARVEGIDRFGDRFTGPYTVTLTEVVGDLSPWSDYAPRIELDTPVATTIDFQDDEDRYSIELEAGRTYDFVWEAGSASNGGVVLVYDPDGNWMNEYDIGYTDTNRLFQITTTQGGVHDLFVSSAFRGEGTVTARVSTDLPANVTTPATIAIGSSVEQTFEFSLDADWFAVDLEAGISYAFSLAGAGTLLALYDAAGNWVTSTPLGDVTLDVGVATTGRYYIEALTEVYRADYTLTAALSAEIPNGPTTTSTLTEGVAVTETLSPADSDWFAATLADDTTYRVTYTGVSGRTTFIGVHDAAGATVALQPDMIRPFMPFGETPRPFVFSTGDADPAFLSINRNGRGSDEYTLRYDAVADVGQTDAGAATLAPGADRRGHLFQGDVDRFILDLPADPVAAGEVTYLVSVTGEGFGTRPILGIDSGFPNYGDPDIREIVGTSSYEVVHIAEDIPGGQVVINVSEETGRFGQTGTPFYTLRVDQVTADGDDGNRLTVTDGLGLLAQGGDDTVVGTAGDDLIWGGTGDDLIFAVQGGDRVRGQAGNDTLHMGAGDDRAEGGIGHDLLIGHGGDDHLSGNGGSDILIGGAGDDTLVGGANADQLTGGAGADTFYLSREDGPGHDWIADYDAAEGDILALDGAVAPLATSSVRFVRADLENVGEAGVDDVIVTSWLNRSIATSQILAVLVDGTTSDSFRYTLGGQTFDVAAGDLMT
ncbi:calcium-binding protein [Jannaschia sp. 2305UL9-9]|uniref:calcium-binding protein n=1 Tax=Jannaschia sp. 2305UL9-9 TaxID=3121638 RepID=UPI0035283351